MADSRQRTRRLGVARLLADENMPIDVKKKMLNSDLRLCMRVALEWNPLDDIRETSLFCLRFYDLYHGSFGFYPVTSDYYGRTYLILRDIVRHHVTLKFSAFGEALRSRY